MMNPRAAKKLGGIRRGPPPDKGPMAQGLDMAASRAAGVPKMGVGTPAEMAPPRKMRMAAETMGTSEPTPMKKGGAVKKAKGGLAKKGEGVAQKGFKKGGMASKGKGKAGLMIVIGVGKKKGK